MVLQDKDSPAHSRGRGKELVLLNLTYEEEGLWRCTASSTIKGQLRQVHSQVLRLGITGQPLVMAREGRELQQASLQEDKDIQVTTFIWIRYPGDHIWIGYNIWTENPGYNIRIGYQGDLISTGYTVIHIRAGYVGDHICTGYPVDHIRTGYPGDQTETEYPAFNIRKGYLL